MFIKCRLFSGHILVYVDGIFRNGSEYFVSVKTISVFGQFEKKMSCNQVNFNFHSEFGSIFFLFFYMTIYHRLCRKIREIHDTCLWHITDARDNIDLYLIHIQQPFSDYPFNALCSEH